MHSINKLEETIEILSRKHKTTINNGKLAIWLADRKDNLDSIESNNSDVEVLIFKQAIALGWDCPRAHILVMFRDIQTPTFEIDSRANYAHAGSKTLRRGCS